MPNPIATILRPVKDKIVRAVSAPYSPKVLESATARFADIISKENPKLTDIEVLKKATTQATKKLEWERVQKPYLEKKYGALAKASYVDSNPAKMQNVAEVVEARKRKANEFLDQPTEPWKPPRKELQAFDRAAIKEALAGFPDVEQSAFPRDVPARASTAHVEELYDDPENRALIEKQIKRGLPLGGETFYASLYPLKLAVMEAGMPAEKFDKWVHSIAPASARNSIMNEMAVGQLLRNMNARGIPLTEENVTKEMAAFKEKFGISVPLMPVHRQGVQNVIEGGQNLRDMSIANIPTNYKIPTYGSQKAGDFAKSIVLDVHEAAGLSQGSRFHPYFKEQGGFGNTEYGVGEKGLLGIAEDMGLPGGMAQAGRWFGGGELTGLKSPRGDALDLLEKQVAYTLKQKGVQPNPANVREEILRQIETGEGDLLPWYRKEGMPDVRETGLQRAEGGAVSQDAMNLAVMNQKVQRKMGGGGAKSKNAPKFTEAFTQGLGPMLYGAARGTAAGLAGLGGDIEELARLGINYAGDKLQGRFPNMLDKRDVVSPKATLPTSELVLSKIPSLKDFGAGTEARHSEDIAAKLGMYGLTNIAAPKAGKAVVQGVNATGKALAPKAGQMAENYMMKSGMMLPMDVWHGTPHRFPPTAKNPLGEFDATKIGTGEGAQAYGHGHYLAEARGVGSGYQQRLTDYRAALDGVPIDPIKSGKGNLMEQFPNLTENEAMALNSIIGSIYSDPLKKGVAGARKGASMLRDFYSRNIDKVAPEHLAMAQSKIDDQIAKVSLLNKLGSRFDDATGNLYKVDLPDAQIAKMLDWDKPLSEQSAEVKAALQAALKADRNVFGGLSGHVKFNSSEVTGSDLYKNLRSGVDAQKEIPGVGYDFGDVGASNILRDLGIPGIRYLDQGSRNAGEGTRNFVVFPGNEEMLNILSREKDGGLVHGKKNGGEAKKPFSNDFERRQQMAGSVMPSQREMEEALRPATVNSLLKRAADRRQGKAMQEEPEYPETQPEGEVRPYDPTFRQDKSAKIQRGLESLGVPIPRARSIAQNIMGEGGTGVLDFEPISSTLMSLQETKRAVERARDKGDQTGVVTELGLGALNAAAGLWGTKVLAKTLASSIKKSPYQRYSQAEFDRILREGELKQLPAPPAPPKLLNGPTEQRLLNAPKRAKTVFEMQHELAQKHAMLPKSQYGLELPPGNTAAQRLEAMGFDTPAYHSTKQDPTVLLPRPPASSRRGTDFGVHVGVNPETANGAIIPPWYEKTMRDQATRADLPASIRGESLKDIENYYKDSQVMPLLVNTGKSLEMPDLGRWNSPNNMLHNIGASSGVWPNYSLKKGVKTNDPDALNELIKNAGQAEGEKLFSEVKDELHKKAIEDMLRKRGYGSIAYPNTVEGKGDISLMFTDPDRLRSRFAAGDPFRRNAAVAAATGMAAPDLLAEEYANGGQVTSDDLILIERKR